MHASENYREITALYGSVIYELSCQCVVGVNYVMKEKKFSQKRKKR